MKTRIKRRATLLILAAVLLTSLCSTVLAEAEIPKEEVSPYRIVLTAPGGWSSSNSAVIKVQKDEKLCGHSNHPKNSQLASKRIYTGSEVGFNGEKSSNLCNCSEAGREEAGHLGRADAVSRD